MRCASLLALLALAACSATSPPPCPCAPVSAAPSSASAAPASQRAAIDVLKRALPGVVLLLNQRSDGKLGFGSGVLLDERGLVLTNLHVVANASSLGAMLHDPGRVSFTPMDGGLARYFFENQKDVVAAHLVRGDPTLDLAIVQIETDTSRYARLPFRTTPVEVGEQVLALGHPQETVWSFTSGMVSSIHLGAIQHDAAINPGNSGGPLIDMSGQVVGVNTAKLLSTVGVGFARPIAMASYLIDQATAPFDPDLSTPEKAILSCARASELASPSYYNCLDWDAIYAAHERALPETIKSLNLSQEAAAKFTQVFKKLGKEYWIGMLKKAVMAETEGRALEAIGAEHGEKVRTEAGGWGPLGMKPGEKREEGVAEIQRMISDFKAFQAELDQDLLKRNGLKVDRRNPRGRVDVRKMGIRVDAVMNPSPGRAWVGASGRNLDGTIYRYSAYFVKVGDEWKERHPFPEDAATLPAGWPPPLSSYPKDLAKARAYLTAVIMSGDSIPEKR
ncbi:MAG: trypsin-like peptidase domain-containing protein [Polyangiaceae bacterium]|nr:trypsin-like peptidase domain-containing protein [Polyangiaceae bacterium]